MKESPIRSKETLRLWLRMLPCVNMVEQILRARFREHYGMSLPQFDVMAQLGRSKTPQTMSELSRHLVVSSGNVTGLVDRLVKSGCVIREPSETDRRVQYVKLTEKGHKELEDMARAHEIWLTEIFHVLSDDELAESNRRLMRVKASLLQFSEIRT